MNENRIHTGQEWRILYNEKEHSKNALKTKSAVIIAVIISVLFVSGCGKSSGVSNNDVLDTSEVSTQEETTVDTPV